MIFLFLTLIITFSAKESLAATGLPDSTARSSFSLSLEREWLAMPEFHDIPASRMRSGLVVGITALYDYSFYQTLNKPWWSGDRSSFHFKNDWWGNYALETDKLAHAYAGQIFAPASAQSWQWAGYSRRTSLLLGGLSSLVTLTEIEVMDGFTGRFGFSTPDYLANIAGAFFPYAQDVWPILQPLTFKMSYHTARYEKSGNDALLEDYDRMTFWLTLDINSYLPEPTRKYWPDWLGIAVGYGVNNAFAQDRKDRQREIYISLDFDPSKISTPYKTLNTVLSALKYIHLPAPSIRITPDATFFAIYF